MAGKQNFVDEKYGKTATWHAGDIINEKIRLLDFFERNGIVKKATNDEEKDQFNPEKLTNDQKQEINSKVYRNQPENDNNKLLDQDIGHLKLIIETQGIKSYFLTLAEQRDSYFGAKGPGSKNDDNPKKPSPTLNKTTVRGFSQNNLNKTTIGKFTGKLNQQRANGGKNNTTIR